MSATGGRQPGRSPDSRGPDIGLAPGDLGTLQAFVNTLDIEEGTDALASPAALDDWLRQSGLTSSSAHLAEARDLTMALELREAFRDVLRSHVTHRSERTAARSAAESIGAARVADIAAAMQAGIDVAADGRIVVVPAGSGPSAALTRLLLIGAEAATAGTWTRLKVCSADDCQWAFYDRSPTRSGCWCSMQICGSRAKSRAYRSRVAGPAAPPA